MSRMIKQLLYSVIAKYRDFVSGEQINYLPMPKITIFCSTSSNNCLILLMLHGLECLYSFNFYFLSIGVYFFNYLYGVVSYSFQCIFVLKFLQKKVLSLIKDVFDRIIVTKHCYILLSSIYIQYIITRLKSMPHIYFAKTPWRHVWNKEIICHVKAK